VVDDGSSDGSADVARQSGANVRVFEQANRGPGAARNLAIGHATREYVAFLDSDDVWFPWTLRTYARVIHAAANPSFVAGKPLRFHDASELGSAQEQPVAYLSFKDYLASGDEWRWWGVSSFVVRRDAIQECGGFAEESINGEDADLALKLGTAPEFVQITQPVTFGYREHSMNLTVDLDKNLAGIWHKIRTEQAQGYSGGAQRERERWRILTRHARPMMLACLRAGRMSEGWRMYRATFPWHAAMGRWKFLLGFPLQTLIHRRHTIPAAAGTNPSHP
jgi:GT2 family glycosyltransferase